jgi:hypothetical protein
MDLVGTEWKTREVIVKKPTMTSGLTLVSGNTSVVMTVNNADANNPSAFELSFPDSLLEASAYDSGTATSPVFAMRGAGQRSVTLVRGSGIAPGDATQTETITAKLADGTTQQQDVIVEAPLSYFYSAVAVLGAPTIEIRMDAVDGSGKLITTGSVSIPNATPFGAWLGLVANAVPGFTHYFEQSALTDYLQVDAPMSAYCRNTNRSWIFVWEHDPATAVTGKTMSESNASSANDNGWGTIGLKSGVYQSQSNGGATLSFNSSNGTHSAGGTAETLTTAVGELCLLVISYDAATPPGSLIFRWKQASHATGHTHATQATTVETASGSNYLNIAGDDSSFSGHPVRWRYFGIIDSLVNTSEYNTLAATIGLL